MQAHKTSLRISRRPQVWRATSLFTALPEAQSRRRRRMATHSLHQSAALTALHARFPVASIHKAASRKMTTVVAAAAAAAPQGAVYRQPGPYRTYQLKPITIRVGGDDELPITTTITLTMPIGAPSPARLVLISAGFLLNGSLYASYAADLAAWGYAVALYDVSEVMDDKDTVAAIQKILDCCLGGDAQLRPLIDHNGAALIGHSRGGKLSCLVAAASPSRVHGLLLLDPVDNTPMTPAGEGYPSALPGLARVSLNIPVLVVGAGSGGDVVPESANYKRFSASCRGPVWNVDLQGAGHLAFLDQQIQLFTLFSAAGSTPDAFVRAASKASCSEAVQAANAEITRMVKGEAVTTSARLPSPSTSSAQSSNSSARSNQSQSDSQTGRSMHEAGSSRRPSATPPVTESYEQLMSRRARELKAMLVERGIRCDDCFEKEQLAQRIVETCSVAAR